MKITNEMSGESALTNVLMRMEDEGSVVD